MPSISLLFLFSYLFMDCNANSVNGKGLTRSTWAFFIESLPKDLPFWAYCIIQVNSYWNLMVKFKCCPKSKVLDSGIRNPWPFISYWNGSRYKSKGCFVCHCHFSTSQNLLGYFIYLLLYSNNCTKIKVFFLSIHNTLLNATDTRQMLLTFFINT